MLSGPPDSAGQKWDVAARGHRQASDSSRSVFIIALERGFLVNAFGSWEAEKIWGEILPLATSLGRDKAAQVAQGKCLSCPTLLGRLATPFVG